MNERIYPVFFCIACAGLLISGCATKKIIKKTVSADPATAQASPGYKDLDPEESSARGKQFERSSELSTIYFEYDKYKLSEAAKNAMQKNAEWIKSNHELEIQIEGHCDERGTTEYNLALGQSRAVAVRNYYKALGIKTGRMFTISYGEEKPACYESTEKCWHLNRRAETLIINK